MPLLVNNDRISDGGRAGEPVCVPASSSVLQITFLIAAKNLYFFQIMTVFPIIL